MKSSGNAEKGLLKKLKGFDGLAMSIGNGNAEKAEGDMENVVSQRYITWFCMFSFKVFEEHIGLTLIFLVFSAETEGSSNGSDGNTEVRGLIIFLTCGYLFPLCAQFSVFA